MPPTSVLNTDEQVSASYADASVILDVDGGEEIYEQPPPGPSLGERHVVIDDFKPTSLTSEQRAEAARCLRSSSLFQFCSDESIIKVVDNMRREEFSEGEVC